MAWLRKYISRNTYVTIVGLWNALSVFVGSQYLNTVESIATLTFINTVGNLIIVWLGVESGHANTETKETGTPES